jgi:hypothetical protein
MFLIMKMQPPTGPHCLWQGGFGSLRKGPCPYYPVIPDEEQQKYLLEIDSFIEKRGKEASV